MTYSSSQGMVTRYLNILKADIKEANGNLEILNSSTTEQVRKNRISLTVIAEAMEKTIGKLQGYFDKLGIIAEGLKEGDKHFDTFPTTQTEVQDTIFEAEQLALKMSIKLRLTELNEEGTRREISTRDNTLQAGEQTIVVQQRNTLPPTPIPKFSGNRWEFQAFWTVFNKVIHEAEGEPAIKFMHLLKHLEGDAKQEISSYQITDENYPIVIERLKNKYFNDKATIADLSEKLEKAKAEGNHISAQRRLHNEVNLLIEQLRSRGEKVGNRGDRERLLKKFKISVQKKVMDLEPEDEDWTLEELLKALDKAINKEEKQASRFPEEHPPRHQQQTNKAHQKTSDVKPKPDTTESLQEKSATQQPKKDRFEKQQEPSCVYCKSNQHPSTRCEEVTKPERRKKILNNESRCFNCTGLNHGVADCKSKRSCFVCHQRHHTSIHEDDHKQKAAVKEATEVSHSAQNVASSTLVTEQTQTALYEVMAVPTQGKRSYLPTITAKAYNKKTGDWEAISIMVDTGADRSYIKKVIADSWELERTEDVQLRIQTFGVTTPEESERFQTHKLWLQSDNGDIQLQVIGAPTLAGRFPKAKLSDKDIEWIQANQLPINGEALQADSTPAVIIGCDYIPLISQGYFRRLPSGVSLIHTIFGYTTLGKEGTEPLPTLKLEPEDDFLTSVNMIPTEEDMLAMITNDQIKREAQEFTGSITEEKKQLDEDIRKFFRETTEKRGRSYYVRIPFKKEVIKTLPDNYAIAKKRLDGVLRKNNIEVLKMVDDIFQDQLEKGIIEIVPNRNENNGGYVHYNPHQPVLTPHKNTTKCRVVFDASAHFRDEPSLNDAVVQGPVILPDALGMLHRFRSGNVAMIADVEKAFLQVFLQEEYRDVTRMLWVKDLTKPAIGSNLVVLRSTRVFFGLNASPYLLGDTCIHHLESHENQELAQTIINNLYVDNLIISGDNSTEQNINLYHQLKAMFDDMGMNLREFLSNDQSFNQRVEEKDRAKDEENTKVLGIKWVTTTDQLIMSTSIPENPIISKRSVASTFAQIYDPLGLMVPLLLPFKIFQRQLWEEGPDYTWDSKLTPTHEEQWHQLSKEANGFTKSIPRMCVSKSEANRIFTFCDASKDAVAVCIYVSNSKGSNILFGKSKIRPVKDTWTIPKMELHAVKMGASYTLQTWKHLREGNVEISEIHIFSDNKATLGWLRAHPGKKEAGVLVYNRIQSIRQINEEFKTHSTPVFFGYVDTKENPADLGTRGLDAKAFANSSTWWEGPQFIRPSNLSSPQPNSWKKAEEFQLVSTPDEVARIFAIQSISKEETETIFTECTNRYDRMIRIAAYVLRAVKKFSKRLPKERLLKNIPTLRQISTDNGSLTTEECQAAETVFLQQHQKEANIHRQSWRNLKLSTNERGLLVCRGRFGNSEMNTEAKAPIFIIPNSHVAKMIIWAAHGTYHRSTTHTMATVRRKFWIPNLRRQTKAAVRQCVPCQRYNNAPFRYPDMGDLPEYRVNRARPFDHVGLDYFGPIQYKSPQSKTAKAYGCVFTCAVTRLIHIEVVYKEDTMSFIMAFRRFVAIRGTPQRVISDNAPIFVLANKILEQLKDQETSQNAFKPEIQEYLTKTAVQWRFITPYAPWQGGMYERLMRSIKGAFRKALGRKILHQDELTTVFQEIAGMLNSRPLTYIGDDMDSGHPLTPNDFISASIRVTIPMTQTAEGVDEWQLPTEEMETRQSTIRALQSSVELIEQTWNIWYSVYLAELREVHKIRMNNKSGINEIPRVGSIVLICDPDHPRNLWKLAKVIETKTSSDGMIREATLRNANGRIIKRPVNLIVPLEVTDDEEQHQIEDQLPPIRQDNVTEKGTTELITESQFNEGPGTTSTLPTTGGTEHPSGYKLRTRTRQNYAEDVSTNIVTSVDNDMESSTQKEELRPGRSNGSSRRNTNTILTTIMMMAMLASTISATDSGPICTPTGVQLRHHYDTFEVCAKDYCTSRPRLQWHNEEKTDVWLPPAIKVGTHHVIAKSMIGDKLSTFELDCPAVSTCDTIDCTICFANLLNPECHPKTAIAALGFVTYITLLLIQFCIKALRTPFTIGEPCKLGASLIGGIWRGVRQGIQQVCRIGIPNRRAEIQWSKLIPIFCIILTAVQGCQEVDLLTEATTVCTEQPSTCYFVTKAFLTINQFKKESCIRLSKNNTTTKEIRVKFLAVRLQCIQEPIMSTKDVELKVWSSKRCPRTGSCTPSKCTEIRRDSRVQELDPVNNKLGATGCTESCGGPGCGCFYPSSGCLFYRIYAEERSFETFDIFKCIEWTEGVRMTMTITDFTLSTPATHQLEMQVPLNKPEPFGGVTVTAEALHTPTSPILNTWFIRNKKDIALWDEHLLPTVQCSERNSTIQDCEFKEECTCTPAEEEMKCACKDENVQRRFNSMNKRLPLAEAHWRLKKKDETVMAEITDATSVKLVIAVKELTTAVVVKTTEECNIHTEHIIGCYGCATGGSAEVTCTSSHQETIGNIICGEDMFTIPCSTNGKKSNITFFADIARFHRRCSINCGGLHTEEFEINGILKFTGSIWTSLYRVLDGNTTITDEINFPDFGHIVEGYLTFMKSVASILIVAAIAFAVTGAIVTSFILMGTTKSIRMVITCALLPIRAMKAVSFFCWNKFRPTRKKSTKHMV